MPSPFFIRLQSGLLSVGLATCGGRLQAFLAVFERFAIVFRTLFQTRHRHVALGLPQSRAATHRENGVI